MNRLDENIKSAPFNNKFYRFDHFDQYNKYNNYNKYNDQQKDRLYDGYLYNYDSFENNYYIPNKKSEIKMSHNIFDKNFLELCIPENDYILGIKYINDAQITVTGKPLINENILDACNRELMEETGLKIVNFQNIKKNTSRQIRNYKQIIIDTIVVNIKDIKPILSKSEIISTDNQIDDMTKRIQVCIHGSVKEFNKLLSDVSYKDIKEGDIAGVAIFDKNILNLYNKRYV